MCLNGSKHRRTGVHGFNNEKLGRKNGVECWNGLKRRKTRVHGIRNAKLGRKIGVQCVEKVQNVVKLGYKGFAMKN